MEQFQEPVVFFLVIMTIILVAPILSERVRLPGIVGIILGGMLIGPHGLNLLAANDRMEFLSVIGLVYLMFSAGLEVDFHQFIRVRGRALVFGLLTFLFPQLMGMTLGWILGMPWLGMVLLGSAFASHTLIAFPILTRLGVTRNEAVAVTAGATILTDIGAFVILAIVLGAKDGELAVGYFVKLFVLLILFGLAIFFVLPRVGKWFFQRFSGRAIEFQFVIVVLFVAALGARLIGVHEVVGAFLAGLAINATVPRHSPVTGHVLFMGESFFIPVFLLYSGMITDPLTLFRNPQAIFIAVGILLVAYVSKFVAAWITGRIFHYTKAELFTVYGLSHAQAAVTIPTLVIGMHVGLFDANLFNAAILMILFTSITSPLLVQKFAPGLHQAHEETESLPLFHRILVPLADPSHQENLLSLASLMASAGKGVVLALNVAREERGLVHEMHKQKELLERVPELLNDPDIRIELIPRLANTYAQGILHTSMERQASLILMGWRGKRNFQQNILGSVLDEVVWGSDLPVMVGKLPYPINGMERVLLLLPAKAVAPEVLRRILLANVTIAEALNVPLSILADGSFLHQVGEILKPLDLEPPCEVVRMQGSLRIDGLHKNAESDLLVIPGYGSRQRFLANIGNLPERLAASFNGNIVLLHFDR
ncbi:MAG: CPA2 family transporter [Chloroflexi bacterium]|nr:MAG: CPA2 family transporter [Chloroflexota bacterium]